MVGGSARAVDGRINGWEVECTADVVQDDGVVQASGLTGLASLHLVCFALMEVQAAALTARKLLTSQL